MGGRYGAWEAGEWTPEAALALTKPTDDFLCPLSANTYGLDFKEFEIKDYDRGISLFHVARPADAPAVDYQNVPEELEEQIRSIRYTFPLAFFEMKTIRTSLVFSVGDKPMPNFRMIERHYFRDQLQRSYDFTFGFCIPGSTNSWEAIYPLPELSGEMKDDMTSSPYEMRSDSFYFVDNKLVMHNKSAYCFAE
jgi:hypothetical protein